jgi:hypothetical protein
VLTDVYGEALVMQVDDDAGLLLTALAAITKDGKRVETMNESIVGI